MSSQSLPAMALVHHALAADLARIDIVDTDKLVELFVKAVVLGLELAWEVLEKIHLCVPRI